MTGGRPRAETTGGLLVGMAALMFGVVVVLGKFVLQEGVSVFAILSVRFAIAALVLAAALAIVRHPLKAAPGELRWLLVLGAVGYSVEASCFFFALQHGTAAAVTLLFYTYPVFVALATLFRGRGKPTPALAGALACTMAGAAVVVGTSGGIEISWLGVAFALGAALSFTAYLLGAEHVMKKTSVTASSMWVCGSASVGLAVFMVVSGGIQFPSDGPAPWAAIAGMGVATTIAFACTFAGLRRVGAVRTAIVSSTEPLAAAVLALVFLSEPIGLGTIVGGVLILSGAVTAAVVRPAAPADPPIP